MLSRSILLCVVFIAVNAEVAGTETWPSVKPATLPSRVAGLGEFDGVGHPIDVVRGKVREGVPPPLCAGRCAAPPAGPVCAFDATGTARTFRTLCELEAVSCRESTYYAITSLGEC